MIFMTAVMGALLAAGGCDVERAITVARGAATADGYPARRMRVSSVYGPLDWKAFAALEPTIASDDNSERLRSVVASRQFFYVTFSPPIGKTKAGENELARVQVGGDVSVFVDADECARLEILRWR